MKVKLKYAICSVTYYVGSLTEHAELWWFTADKKWVDDIEDAILFESEETAQTEYQNIVDTQEFQRFHGGCGLNIVDVLWNDCSDDCSDDTD